MDFIIVDTMNMFWGVNASAPQCSMASIFSVQCDFDTIYALFPYNKLFCNQTKNQTILKQQLHNHH